MVVKLRLQGKTMRVYIGIDPEALVGTKYNIRDVSPAEHMRQHHLFNS